MGGSQISALARPRAFPWPRVGDTNALRSLTGAAAALVFHFVNGLATILTVRFPSGVDGRQHLSFIRAMEQRPQLFPRYQDLRVLDASNLAFTTTPNYLNHPSPYYLAMGVIDRLTGGSIAALRAANLSLSLIAVGIFIAGGFQLFKGWRERTIFAGALVLFPKLGLIAGLINNDNAALLAVALTFLGLVRWQKRPDWSSAILLSIGLALCGWTKLTVLIMAGAATMIAELLRIHARTARPTLLQYAAVVAGFTAAAVPTLANLAAYGRPLYIAWRPHQAPPGAHAMSFGAYADIFFHRLINDWSALDPTPAIQLVGLLWVTALSAVWLATAFKPPSGEETTARAATRIAAAFLLATLPALALHLLFGWRTYLENGETNSGLMRYYYGVWPGVALALTLLRSKASGKVWLTPALIGTGLLLLICSPMFMEFAAIIHGRELR